MKKTSAYAPNRSFPYLSLLVGLSTAVYVASACAPTPQVDHGAAGRAGLGGAPAEAGADSGESGANSGGLENAGGTSANTSGDAGTSGEPGGAAGESGQPSTGNAEGGAAGDDGGSGGTSAGAPPAGDKFVGNIDTRAAIRPDFSTYWDQFTPENAGKWGQVEAERDQMDWTRLDTMVAYAKQHHIVFKQHNFVWGSQQPDWIAELPASEQRAEVEEWIRLFCERYPDTALIDVVNEPPPHTTPPYVDALGGAGDSGYDWIVQSFAWAHEYCPQATLILNDFNNIEYSGDAAHTIDIVNRVKAAGAPIHAVGAQAHDAYRVSAATLQANIARIAAETGLPVYISEYDIDLADDTQQLGVMQQQFPVFYTDPNVAGITLWGYVSGMTWRTNTGLMADDGTPRPALSWLREYLGR